MNCTRCGYLLFGVASGRCPECGGEYSATDYRFPAGSVRFLCPSCQQSYLGNDAFGLPYPRSFECARCGQHLHAGRMAVHPAAENAFGEPLRVGTDWDRRARLGVVRAFVGSMTGVAIRPAEFFRLSITRERSAAIGFGVLAIVVAQAFWLLVALPVWYLYSPVALPPSSLARGLIEYVGLLTALVTAFLLWTYAYAYSMCLVLWITGETDTDMNLAVQIAAYSAAVLPAVPPIGLLWYVAVARIGLRELAAVTPGRALLAATLLPLLTANAVVAAVLLL